MVGAGQSVAATRVDGRGLLLSGDAADPRGYDLSLGSWRRTCVCGIWLSVALQELPAGCALEDAASYINRLGMALLHRIADASI